MAEVIPSKPAIPQVEGVYEDTHIEGQRLYDSSYEVKARFRLYPFALGEWDLRRQVLDYAEKHYDLNKAENILEWGCASGEDLIDLKTSRGYQGHLRGIDVDEHAVFLAADKVGTAGLTGIEFLQCGAEDLSAIEDGSLDAIMSWYMMYETEPDQALAEGYRKLKDNGLMILTTHGEFNIPLHRRLERLMSLSTNSYYKNPEIRSRRFAVDIGKRLLKQAGFIKKKEYHTICPIKVPPESKDVYRDSIDTRQREFNPIPRKKHWEKLMTDIVDPYIDSEIKAQGYILDFMDRWGAVYQKPPVSEV